MYNKVLFYVYAALFVIFSLAAMIAFFQDKKKAIKGQERTKEKTLLFITVFQGGLGALFGSRLAHHKTDKVYFSITIYLSVICQIAIFALLLYKAFIV